MSKGKMSILRLLRKENMSCNKIEVPEDIVKVNLSLSTHENIHGNLEMRPKLSNHEYDTQKEIISKNLAKKMYNASKFINKVWYWYLLKKNAKNKQFLTDIYFEADHDIAENVFIVGEFTTPKWLLQIPMKYSFFHHAFWAKIKIHDNWQFKFIIDGNFIWWSRYPMTYSQEKFTNNIFKVNKFKRYSDSMIRNEIRSIKLDLNLNRNDLIRKKNSQIISQIANKAQREISAQWLNMKNKISLMSPELKICSKRSLNQSDLFNKFSKIKRESSNISNSWFDSEYVLKSINYK